jgi:hypothetical protein
MPAYNAAKTLARTVAELDRTLVDDVIVVDDASSDGTVEIASALGLHHLVHPRNRGYGGNQKTCYREALARNADIVVMLHPDYQYSPLLVPAMAAMIASEHFDAVLGSRILGTGALKGGMPLWKYAANRALTFVENLLLGYKLSEYHSGLRAFSRKLLESLPLDQNSDDFAFDNQMLVQAIWQGFNIGEITCPARYFEEASSINFQRSVKYGMGVLAAAVEFRAAQSGLYRSPRLLPEARSDGFPRATPVGAGESTSDELVAEPLGQTRRRALAAAIFVHVLHVVIRIVYFAPRGQDFAGHMAVLESVANGTFLWSGTNPPGSYLVAHWIGKLVSRQYDIELTSLFFLALNLAVLWPLDRTLKRLRVSSDTRLACLLVLIFVPFWVVHAVVFSADAATVPLFFAAYRLTIDILKRVDAGAPVLPRASALALVLLVGIFTKYSFCFLMAAVALVFTYEAWRRRSSIVAVCLLSLLPALGMGAYEYKRAADAESATLHGHYLKEGEEPSMSVSDLVLPKRADRGLLAAPQYFEDKVYERHRYGYWGLLHLTTFTDVMNWFQTPAPDVPVLGPNRPRTYVTRQRHTLAHYANVGSVNFALPLSLIAVIGVVASAGRAARELWSRTSLSDGSILLCYALSFYLTIFGSLPRIATAYEHGYWLPRLVMPSLVSFLLLGFAVLDERIRHSRGRRVTLVAYATILSALFLVALSGAPI